MQLLSILIAFLLVNFISNIQLFKRYKSQKSKDLSRPGFIGTTDLYQMDYMFIGNAKIDFDFYGEMAILLYTNKTFAANCPPQFLFYNCTYFIHCTWSATTPFELAMPFFNLSGYMIETEFFLGSQSGNTVEWGGAFLDVYYAQNCSAGYSTDQLYGALGLGIDGGAYRNFLQDMAFSILLSSDGEEGYLIFGQEFYLDNTVFLANITKGITYNWHISMGTISFGTMNLSVSGEVVFDLSSAANYIPYTTMTTLIQWLNAQGLNCSTSTFITPTCYCEAVNCQADPLIFTTTYGESFSIPSTVYLVEGYQSIFYLNFIGTTTDSSMNNAQIVSSDYANIIFIGNQFMLGKLVQFNFENLDYLYISIYEGTIPSTIEYNDIVFGIVIGLIFLLIIYTVFKIYRKTNKTDNTRENIYQPVPSIVEAITPGGGDT